MKLSFTLFLLFFLLNIISFNDNILFAQPIPEEEQNIPYLVTFGKNAKTTWGDDDFNQTFFYVIPKDQKKPFFIRVFDPETGGSIDELKAKADTKIKFSVYGGKGTFSNFDATAEQPKPQINSGTLLASKTFENNTEYDGKWYSFGPFNPVEGEFMAEFGGYIIKIVSEGLSGDDGNLYKYYLSTDAENNMNVEGANSFTYEYTFRLFDKEGSVSHIYPFVNKDVISVKIHTFDFDNDGMVRIVSQAKKHEIVKVSGDNDWIESLHQIEEKEKNTSLDIQMIKLKTIKDNNVVFYITNQYGKLLPFFTSPIGGVKKFKYEIGVKPHKGISK